MSLYEQSAGRNPVSALLERYPYSDPGTVNELASLEVSDIYMAFLQPVSEEYILSLAIARSPRLRRAHENWQASLNRYPQSIFLQDVLNSYRGFSEGMSLGLGKEYQRGMIQMNYPAPGMLSLRGQVVESDVDAAYYDYITEGVNLIAEARDVIAKIRNKEELIAINSASVSRLSVLKQVAQAQYVSGTRSFSDLIRIDTELDSRRDMLSRVRSMKTGLYGSLASLLDLPADTEFPDIQWADEPSSELSFQPVADLAMEANPELAKIDSMIDKMDSMVEMTLRRADPDLTNGFTYFQGRDIGSLDSSTGNMNMDMETGGSMPAGSEMESDGTDMGSGMPMDTGASGSSGMDMDSDMGSMSFMFNPMLDHRSTNYPLDFSYAIELMNKKSAMEEMLDAKSNMIAGMIRMQVTRYNQMRSSTSVYRTEIIPAADAALNVVRSGYTSNENNFNDLIGSELSLLMSRMDLANIEYERRNAYIEIEKLIGHSIRVEGEQL
jgi:outer membrane protein TolC